jgi:putative DNA primase/helicase
VAGNGDIRSRIEDAPEAAGSKPVVPDDPELDLELTELPFNDLGNAERLMRRHGRDLKYIEGIGWHVWSGTHWDGEKGPAEAQIRAQSTAEAIAAEVAALQVAPMDYRGYEESKADRNDRLDRLLKWSVTSGNATRLRGLLEVAAPQMTLRRDDLDRSPWLLNVLNGTLEFKPPKPGEKADDAVRLREHRRDDYITRVAPVKFDPDAEAPDWKGFIELVQKVEAKRLYLQRFLGQAMLGGVGEQVCAVWEGKGANGKSTTSSVIRGILGPYVQTAPVEMFLEDDRQSGGAPTPEIARLVGIRIAFASEPNKKRRLDPARIKQVTGGEPLATRELHKGYFEFTPEFTPVISFNERPEIPAADDGTWRRMQILPWSEQIPKEKRVLKYETVLLKGASGILNWLIEGYAQWRELGLAPPEDVLAATQEYRDESDSVGQFVEMATEVDEVAEHPAGEMRAAYEVWCKKSGVPVISMRRFGEQMKKLVRRRKSSITIYAGRRLKPEFKGGSDDKMF